MAWENVGIDRIGCAWLIQRNIDPEAEFVFVVRGGSLPSDAEAFDVPGVRFFHHDEHCSFQSLIEHHQLTDPILHRIARIIDGADTVQVVNVEPAATGLDVICEGLRLISTDDHTAIVRGKLVYDARYARLSKDSERKLVRGI